MNKVAFNSDAKYQKYLVVFLDILGLTEAIKATKRNAPMAPISEMLGRIRSIASSINRAAYKKYKVKEFNAYTFSDTIIITCPEVSKKSFLLMAEVVCAIQFELSQSSFFIRGAITGGNHYENRGVIFGPAFIKAYEMESYAVWPRVIVDPFLLKSIRLSPEYMYAGEVILDQSGWGYLNYSKFVFTRDCCGQLAKYRKGDIKAIDFLRVLSLHRGAILNALDKIPADRLELITKYHALADYHNQFIDSLCIDKDLVEENINELDPELTAQILLSNSHTIINWKAKKLGLGLSLAINPGVNQSNEKYGKIRDCKIDILKTFEQLNNSKIRFAWFPTPIYDKVEGSKDKS